MAALKHALIVRGPNGVGKSRVIYKIREQRLAAGHSCGVAVLDEGWGSTEFRLTRNDPPQRRYGDLVGRRETLLLVEIGLGDPENAKDHKKLGATRNPREWVELLCEEGRQITLVRLAASQTIIEARLRHRSGHAPTQDDLDHIDRIQNDKWKAHGPINFPLRAGLHEDVVDTDADDWDAIVAAVLGKLKHPLQG